MASGSELDPLVERVERLGGKLQVGNREPRGACLRAEIPLAGRS